jgi:addiction module toxin, RelE/StbE family
MKKTKYTVLIFPSAENDIQEIKDYFINILKTSPNGLFEKLLHEIDLLEDNPYIYPLIKDPYLNQLGYRIIPIDNFILFYIVTNNEVHIHRFLYGKRNYKLLF